MQEVACLLGEHFCTAAGAVRAQLWNPGWKQCKKTPVLWRTLQLKVESVLRKIVRAAKAFFRAGMKPLWHLISHLFHCYKTIGAFSSECFEISICVRLSRYIKSACNTFPGEVWFGANEHEAPPHVDFSLVLLRTTGGSLDGSSHFTAPFSQRLCRRKSSAAELGVLLNFPV